MNGSNGSTDVISSSGNTKRNRSRNYCFTWNNYEKSDIDRLIMFCVAQKSEYVFQEEKGETCQTRHLQGLICFPHQVSFEVIKSELPKCHLEKCKSKSASVKYCSKLESRIGEVFTNMKIRIEKKIKDPIEDFEFKPWEHEIEEIILTKPNDRKIYWYWSSNGNIGKSAFAKHLCLKHGALCVSGKANDIKYAIASFLEERDLSIIVLDVPRCNQEFISYQALEEIKNGLFFCGKYESKQIIFDSPHLFVFSNCEPDRSKLSSDRWEVKRLDC